MDSKINPDHYKIGGIETIAYIDAKLTKEQLKATLLAMSLNIFPALNIKTAWKILKGLLVFKSAHKTYSKLE